jgi:hypothetical protein
VTKKQLLQVAHTCVATLIGLAPFVPELVGKLGVSTTAGVGAGAIAIAGAITKLVQVPTVSAYLKKTFNV